MKYKTKWEAKNDLVKYVWTPEEWSPCFAGDRVEVRLSERHPDTGGGWSLGVSGQDDRGASTTFKTYEEAHRKFLAITDGITMADCLEIGLDKW